MLRSDRDHDAAARLDFLGLPGNEFALEFAERTANDRAGYLTLERVALLKPPAGGRDGLAYGSLSGILQANGSQSMLCLRRSRYVVASTTSMQAAVDEL
jgi:hypothetical protein